MSNIIIDVGYSIKDGTEIKFRSPVDCSAITGLIVYYPGTDGNITSKVFTLADANGNNVGDIDHLFAEDVVVKVILDVTKGMAFVQNADTNAYLEAQLASKASLPKSASGSAISIDDAIEAPLYGLTLYGKTIQDGIPTPEAPVELVSAGNGGAINVSITDGTESNVQTVTAQTPGGLNSIGEVKDEIDFARGVRVQRVKGVREFSFSAWDAEKCIYVGRVNLSGVNNNTMCNMYQYSALPVADLPHGTYKKSGEYVYLRDTRYTTAAEINAALNGVLVILGELATPIETPLSAEELAQYAALHTNKPRTTVYNNAGADMTVSYFISNNAAVPIEAGTGNEGKFLRVVNGMATWVAISSAEGGGF